MGLSQYAQVTGEVAAAQDVVSSDRHNDWQNGNDDGRAPLSLLNDGLPPDERGHHHAPKTIQDLRAHDSGSRDCSRRVP
ncbi:hypothetical protein ABZ622_17015 [Streptomyces sp. NPDC007164]|uniref:hypothetical protein n=1 Tax=Streptomyces sp. NPDC007164 TaxID=3156918 RepID=UPI0033DCB08A